jgi:hypothetical protein
MMGYLNILVLVFFLVFATLLYIPTTSQTTFSKISNSTEQIKTQVISSSHGWAYDQFVNIIVAASGVVNLVLTLGSAVGESINALEMPSIVSLFIIAMLSLIFVVKIADYLLGRSGS